LSSWKGAHDRRCVDTDAADRCPSYSTWAKMRLS
jgi:hypothetical protein